MQNNRAQIAIFVIISILIIALVIGFFLFRGKLAPTLPTTGQEINPDNVLKNCLENRVREVIDTLNEQGGYLSNPLNTTFRFDDEKETKDIAYLCYTSQYFVPCVQQEPMLIIHLTDEIKSAINENVKSCYEELIDIVDKKGYVVDSKYKGFEVRLVPKKILIELENELYITKNEQTREYKNFNIIIPSRFYDNALVAQEIISQEAKFCYFADQGFSLIYPEFKITRFIRGDGVAIYSVENKISGELFRFAVRSCVLKTGI